MAEVAEAVIPYPSFDQRDLRNAFGRFATGVTVITAQSESEPVGMTVNSFASVSLEPALVSWCLDNQGGRFAAFDQCQHFAVHILGAGQEQCCMRFARDINAFQEFEHHYNVQGVPILAGALAVFECRVVGKHQAGDHTIMLGEVCDYHWSEGDALGFYAGQLLPIERQGAANDSASA